MHHFKRKIPPHSEV